MARVVQIIATDPTDPFFEPQIVTKKWHALLFVAAILRAVGLAEGEARDDGK
jgi:hypothetical protein